MAVSYLYAGDCIVASAESGDAAPTRCSCGETCTGRCWPRAVPLPRGMVKAGFAHPVRSGGCRLLPFSPPRDVPLGRVENTDKELPLEDCV